MSNSHPELLLGEEIESLSHNDTVDAIANHMYEILTGLGMDIDNNPSVKDTPRRFAKFLLEYHQPLDAEAVLGKVFDSEETSMVLQSHIPFRMICEHHLLPATGNAFIGYLPAGKVIGLSKLTRIVQAVGVEQPTLQEHICDIVANLLEEHLHPRGVMVVIQAEHGCMSCRGVNVQGVTTTTSSIRGAFRSEPSARAEFLALAGFGR